VTDRLIVVGGRDKLVHGIQRANGQKAWTFSTRAKVDSSPIVVGDRVFVGSGDGNLYELNLQDGTQNWKYNVGKPITAGPAAGEGVLVVGCESSEGRVYCFGKK
jgi:outer membrane protein assembly factor BamB